MRDFSKVSPLLWREKRFKELSSAETKTVYLYLLTCEHQNSAGCYRLPDGYAVEDLAITREAYSTARAELVAQGLILFDEGTSELFLSGWFQTNPAMNNKHAMSIKRRISELASDTLRERAEAEFEAAEERRAAAAPPREQEPSNLRPIRSDLTKTRYLGGGQS